MHGEIVKDNDLTSYKGEDKLEDQGTDHGLEDVLHHDSVRFQSW